MLLLELAFPDEMSVLGLGFGQIHFPQKTRLIVQCNLGTFFSSFMMHFWTDATYPPEQLIVRKHPVLSVESGTASVVGVVTYLIQGVNPRGTGDPQRGSVWMKGGS